MPYCCQCGNETKDVDLYCAVCGARQALTGGRAHGASSGITPRSASILCYIPILGWIPAIVALASQRFRKDQQVRFHAFQGIYLFVAWLLVDWVIGPIHHFPFWHGSRFFPALFFGGVLKALLFFTWIFMLIKTSQDQTYKLPILGELAERSVSEQRS